MTAGAQERWLGGFHRRHPLATWYAFLASFFAVLCSLAGIAWLLDPTTVERFLFEHVVGPWLAEARQRPSISWDGVVATSGYTWFTETLYITVILVGLVSAWWLLYRPRDVPLDERYVLALLPTILAGVTVRVLEDASLFCTRAPAGVREGCQASPLAYLAISPLVYIAFFLAAVTITHELAGKRAGDPTAQRGQVHAWLAGQAVLALSVMVLLDGYLEVSIAWTALWFVAGAPIYHLARRRGIDHVSAGLWATSSPWVLIGASYVAWWMVEPWRPAEIAAALPAWVAGVTIAITAAVIGLARMSAGRIDEAGTVAEPLGVAVVAAHLLDGSATFLSVCTRGSTLCEGAAWAATGVTGYSEKHPVSEALLGMLDGWGFVLAKAIVPAALVVGLHRLARDDKDEGAVPVYLLAILLAGLVPGLRNLLRATMGV